MPQSKYNDGCIFGMMGKDCVALGSINFFNKDKIGQTKGFDYVQKINESILAGVWGLRKDCHLLYKRSLQDVQEHQKTEKKFPTLEAFSKIVSGALYAYRYAPLLAEPIIAGYNSQTMRHYLTHMSMMGTQTSTDPYVVRGAFADEITKKFKEKWTEDLSKADLFRLIPSAWIDLLGMESNVEWKVTVSVVDNGYVAMKILESQ